MHLINTETLKLESFEGSRIPLYAILSHTWGQDEITFQEIQLGIADTDKRVGYQKITATCQIAKSHGFDYVWVDTCCIDKKSSAELSEAINTMYRWYEDAAICYAYIADVSIDVSDPNQFAKSRWFTRGWTLQELIAPSIVVFLDNEWRKIGTKSSLVSEIAGITGIPHDILEGSDPRSASVAEKMSWASTRQTTRIEDIAYCLLGIFGVNMPLLYGEMEGAFNRLQEEIIKISVDYSIFAWGGIESPFNSLLAMSPAAFSNSTGIRPLYLDDDAQGGTAITINNQGIHLKLRISSTTADNTYLALLPCTWQSGLRVAIVVMRAGSHRCFRRVFSKRLELVSRESFSIFEEENGNPVCFERVNQTRERQLPFVRALTRGNVNLARFLLEKGHDFGFQCDMRIIAPSKATNLRDDAAVKLFHKNGAYTGPANLTAPIHLHLAAHHGREEVVKLLLEKGADPNVLHDDKAPIHWAAEFGHKAVVELLIEKGGDAEIKDSSGITALYYAAVNKNRAVMELLLKNGVDPESKDKYNRTPLHAAATRGDETLVKLLLDADANTEIKTNDGLTPLHVAAHIGHETVVKSLLDADADVEIKDNSGWTALHYAAVGGHDTVVKLFLEKGIYPDIKDKSDLTPLHTAAQYGDEILVKLFLDAKADAEIKDIYGMTALHAAAGNGHEAVVKLLLERGIDTDLKEEKNRTPLHLAAQNGHITIVKLLIENGANPNQRDGLNQTPLHLAASHSHVAVVKLLLEKGADPWLRRNVNLDNVLDIATHNGLEEVKRILQKKRR